MSVLLRAGILILICIGVQAKDKYPQLDLIGPPTLDEISKSWKSKSFEGKAHFLEIGNVRSMSGYMDVRMNLPLTPVSNMLQTICQRIRVEHLASQRSMSGKGYDIFYPQVKECVALEEEGSDMLALFVGHEIDSPWVLGDRDRVNDNITRGRGSILPKGDFEHLIEKGPVVPGIVIKAHPEAMAMVVQPMGVDNKTWAVALARAHQEMIDLPLVEQQKIWKKIFANLKKAGRNANQVLQTWEYNVGSLKDLTTLYDDPKGKEKRQVVIGSILGLLGGAGATAGVFNWLGIGSQKVEENLYHQLGDIQHEIVAEGLLIRHLNNAVKEFGEVIAHDEGTILKLVKALTYGEVLKQTGFELRKFMYGIAQLKLGNLDPTFINAQYMQKVFHDIVVAAEKQEKRVMVNNVIDLYACRVSHLLTDKFVLHIVLHVPLEETDLQYNLYKYIPTPLALFTNLTDFVLPKPASNYLAVSSGRGEHFEMTEQQFQSCEERMHGLYKTEYHCQHNSIIAVANQSSCIHALFSNSPSNIRDYCVVLLTERTGSVTALQHDFFNVYHHKPEQLRITCKQESLSDIYVHGKVFQGSFDLLLPTGCVAKNEGFIFKQNENPVLREPNILSNHVNFSQVYVGQEAATFRHMMQGSSELIRKEGRTLLDLEEDEARSALITANSLKTRNHFVLLCTSILLIIVLFSMAICYCVIMKCNNPFNRVSDKHRKEFVGRMSELIALNQAEETKADDVVVDDDPVDSSWGDDDAETGV